MTGGRVTTSTSRSKRAVFRRRPFEVARRINFALPSLSWGVVRMPAAKFHVPSVTPEGCAFSQTRYWTPFCSTKASSLRTPCGSRTWTVMPVAWPRVVTGDGRSTTGGACRANRIAIDDKTARTITAAKTFRTSHCSSPKRTGAMTATEDQLLFALICTNHSCSTGVRRAGSVAGVLLFTEGKLTRVKFPPYEPDSALGATPVGQSADFDSLGGRLLLSPGKTGA